MMYFTKETEQWIEKYIISQDEEEKNRIFEKYIFSPFYTIVNSLLHRYKKYYVLIDDTIENLIYDVIGHMVLKIKLYKGSSGKAYSYFSVIAKHYLTNKLYKSNRYLQFEPGLMTFQNVTLETDNVTTHDEIQLEVITNFIIHIKDNYDNFEDINNRKKVLDALLYIFENYQQHNIRSKKSLYDLIIWQTENTVSLNDIKKTIYLIKNHYTHVNNKIQEKYI